MGNSHPNRVKCPKCQNPGTKKSRKTNCGKTNCSNCKDGPSHGPYWYVVHWIGKGTKTGKKAGTKECYIGKTWPEPEVK